MPSGAQLNEWGKGVILLSIAPTQAALAAPLAGYGTIPVRSFYGQPSGANGRYANNLQYPIAGYGNDSGWWLSPRGFSKLGFQIIGPGATTAGYTVSVYGTLDPAAYWTYFNAMQSGVLGLQTGAANSLGGADGLSTGGGQDPGIPATSTVLLEGPSSQAGTGTIANPMVSGTSPLFVLANAFQAYRCVLTTVGAPTLEVKIAGWGIP